MYLETMTSNPFLLPLLRPKTYRIPNRLPFFATGPSPILKSSMIKPLGKVCFLALFCSGFWSASFFFSAGLAASVFCFFAACSGFFSVALGVAAFFSEADAVDRFESVS